MLTCSSCIKRTLQTLVGDTVTIPPPSTVFSSRPSVSFAASPHSKRFYAQQRTPSSSINSATATSYEKAIARRQPDKRQEWLDSRGTRPVGKAQNKPAKAAQDTDFVVRKHLQYLKDPVKLADFVRKSLRSDDFDTTLEVVRSASKTLQCIVSWNHLIDYTLSQGKMNAAIKLYNEMKKRAQFPDGHTYTILFRGCAEHKDTSHALEKVISIYRTMLLDKSKIKPSTIHINAVLKMCARAGDMNSMVTIAAEMPDHGPGSPDTLTYTTLLNALRMDAVITLRNTLTPMQKRMNAREAILRGRYIWQDLTKRWAKGYLWIDEELVCAMGRLLAVGETQDKDDVFHMIEQTMNVPRQIEPLGAKGTNLSLKEDVDLNQYTPPPMDTMSADLNEPQSETQLETFKHAPLQQSSAPRSGLYAKPGRNTLSLVLMALLNSRRGQTATVKGPAANYWNIITKDFRVIPDRENFLAYLRVLRAARSSNETLELLGSMPLKDMDHSTFRIAISCCQRDKRNHKAFANAGKILDYMQQTMSVPDIKVCEAYLDVAIISEAGGNWTDTRNATTAATAKAAQGKQILRALDRLHPHFTNLRSLLSYGDPAPIKERSRNYETQDPSIQEGVIGLTRRMISAVDILIQQSLVPETLHSELLSKKATLTQLVTRYAPKSTRSAPISNNDAPKLTAAISPPLPTPAPEVKTFTAM